MNTLKYFIYKNNTFVIFATCFFSHFVWSIVFLFLNGAEFIPMLWWNIGATIMFGFFVFQYKRLNKLFMFTAFAIELTAYSVFEVLMVRMVCGTELYVIGLIPATFLITADYKHPRFYFLGMNTFFLLSLIIITSLKITWLPPEKLFQPERKLFFLSSELYCTGVVISLLIYICFSAESSMRRLHRRSQFLQRELEYTANHDSLTGLMNRRRSNSIFKICIKKKQEEAIDYGICIFDIDDFKKINDTYGHDAGDFVLKTYSCAIWKALPEPIKIGRWGGEEFLIIYPQITPETVFELESLRQSLANTPIIYKGHSINVTATFGISSSRIFSTAEEILTDADHRLLDGKNHGKNRIVVSEYF